MQDVVPLDLWFAVINVVLRDGKETAQFDMQMRLVFALAMEKPDGHMLLRSKSFIKFPQYTFAS